MQEGEDDWWDAEEPSLVAQQSPGQQSPEALSAELSDGEPSSDDDEDEGEVEDDERYRDMLAAVTGGEGRPAVVARKRRHDVLVSEAYPESEFNLNPNAATAGAYTFSPLVLNRIVLG